MESNGTEHMIAHTRKMKTFKQKSNTATTALVVVGAITLAAFMWPKSNDPTIPIGSQLNPNLGVENENLIEEAALKQQEDHPVTDEMIKTAAELGQQDAADFSLSDGKGTTHSLQGLTANGKPLLIFFIEKQCPCCLGAKHFVDRLADNYEGKASVIGVINATGKEAETWRQLTQPHFLILEDPSQKTIRAYAAERGVYTTLVTPDGKIEKAYPGYSLETLQDISARIARLANIPDKGFKSEAAPKKLTSGCIFPEPETTTENPQTGEKP